MISRSVVVFGVLAVLSISSSFATDDWVVSQNGVGPVKIGMSLSQLNTALHEKFTCRRTRKTKAVSTSLRQSILTSRS